MVAALVTILAAACCLAPASPPRSVPSTASIDSRPALSAAPEKPFRDISISSGINLTGRGRGAAWGDLDGDGLLDLGVGIQEDGFHLYRNLGHLQFREITLEAGIATRAGTNFGVTFVDCDNDLDLDIFLCFGGYQNANRHPQPNRLYLNDGTGHFTEVNGAAGMALPGYNFSASWSDINADGRLDVFICHVNPDDTGGNHLFLNRGGLLFEDVTESAGVSTTAFSQQAIFFDMDDDGDPDLFFTNRHAALLAATVAGFHHDIGLEAIEDSGRSSCRCGTGARGCSCGSGSGGCRCGLPDGAPARAVCTCGSHLVPAARGVNTVGSRLFRNDGTGRFTDISDEAGVSDSQGTFPAAAGDYDNDGDMDLFVGTFNYGPREAYFPGFPDRLYRNEGNGRFKDVAPEAGVADFGGPMGCTMIDFDNDGWLDIYSARGGPEPTRYEYDRFYRNNKDGTFTEMARAAGIVNAGAGHGATAVDADSDGDLDLYIPNGAMVPERIAQQLFFENKGNANSWIQIRPQGDGGNRDPINAKIRLTAGPLSRYHEITAGTSFGSMTPLNAFFGLANEEMVDRLTITWRCGLTRTVEHLPPRRALVALLPVDFAAAAPVVGDGVLAATATTAARRPVHLAWVDTRVPGVGSYELAVAAADNPALPVVARTIDTPEATVELPAGRYIWRVTLMDDLGRVSGAVDPAPFEVTIAAPPAPTFWSATPNPFVETITLRGPAMTSGASPSPGSPSGLVHIYDVRGRLVAAMTGAPSDGALALTWDGRDRAGRPVPGGTYFVRPGIDAVVAPIKIVRARRGD